MKIGFYLKFNTDREYAYRILQKWLDVSRFFESDVYILCDYDEMMENIKLKCSLDGRETFLKSVRDGEISKIAEEVCSPRWYKTACAMLTPFYHMIGRGYDYIWNIDSDDTLIFLSAYRISILLQFSAQYAKDNNLDAFSLDMWFSRRQGKEWTFGVAFLKTDIDWFDMFYRFNNNEQILKKANIDQFFTELKEKKYINAGTFYSNNLRFVHYSDDFFADTETSGFYHWINGKLLLPIDYYCLDIRDRGEVLIHKDAVDIGISVSDGETIDQMRKWSRTRTYSGRVILGRGDIEENICKAKVDRYLLRMGNPKKIVAFGAGPRFTYALQFLKELPEFDAVCDNSELLWGKQINGIQVIPPEQLTKTEEVLVLITVINPNVVSEIMKQVKDLGINRVDVVDNYLRCFD